MCGSASCLALIGEPMLADLYTYWSGKRAAHRFPGRSSIVPEELVAVLPFLLLVDVVNGGRVLRYRLVGTSVSAAIDPTGRVLQDALPLGPYRDHLLGLYDAVLARGAPMFTSHRYAAGPGRPSESCEVDRVFLPLASDGSAIDMILVGQVRRTDCPRQAAEWHGFADVIQELERGFLN